LRSRDAACPPLCLLSLHDALPILAARTGGSRVTDRPTMRATRQNRVRHHESHKRSLPAIAEQCSRACTTTRTCIPHNQQLTRSTGVTGNSPNGELNYSECPTAYPPGGGALTYHRKITTQRGMCTTLR